MSFKKGGIPWNKGSNCPEEWKQKMRIINTGRIGPNRGKKTSEETRKKMSEAARGEKSSQWKGDISDIRDRIRKGKRCSLWRQSVFIRDNFTCKGCGVVGGLLEAHHIIRFHNLMQDAKQAMPLMDWYDACILYTPLWDINNGKTLCHKCHKEYHRNNLSA